MDIFEHTSSDNEPATDGPDVPVAAFHLARAIGRRLGAGLHGSRRDQLLEALVTQASSSAGPAASRGAAASDRISPATARAGAASTAGITPRSHPRPGSRTGRGWSRRTVALMSAVGFIAALGGVSTLLPRTGDDLPLVLLSQGAPGAAAGASADASTSPMRSGEEIGADRMWWTPTIYRFVLADGVAYPEGSAPAWRLVPPRDLAAAAARLATTLDLPALTTSEWDPDALQTATEDGAGLWVGKSGDWYFNGPYDPSLVWDCPAVEGASGPDSPVSSMPDSGVDCAAPEPPTGVPGEARARELALAFLARVGHADVRITDVYAGEWGAWVSAEPVVEGLGSGSGFAVSVGFGGGGRVTSANGTLATVERVGEYPTIDAAAALVRLEAELSAWLTDGGPMARPMPADDAPVSILPVPEPAPEPGVTDPVEQSVTIVKVELVTSVGWTADGSMILMPHYRMTDSDGGWWSVLAVADRYVAR